MKKIIYIICGCLSLLAVASCKKSFLDDPSPADGSLTENIIFSTKAGAENALTGIYWIFREENYNGYGGENLNGVEILTNRGLQTTMFHFEVKGNDLLDIYAGTYWWGNEATWIDGYYTRAAEGSRTYQIWDMFYKAINNANAIIKNVPEVGDASDEEKNALIAEAKAIRAYSYFWLARVYQFPYARNPEAAAIPIYTEPASKESTGNPRASLRETYELIVADIEDAIANLSVDRIAKYRINKNVAQAFAAQIYQELAMADPSLWDKVIDYAQQAREGYALMTNQEYNSGFNNLNIGEWLWGFPINDEESLTYYSIYSYMDQVNGYYRNIYLNSSLAQSYSDTDARANSAIWTGYNPVTYPTYTVYSNKFRSRTSGQMTGDILVLRSAQLLLIEAEALVHKGLIGEAIDKFYELQAHRDNAAQKMSATSSSSEVIDAILLERSKEMYGENGGIYFDLKRLNRPLVRNGNHPQIVNIPADDVRWNLKLPQAEINANQSLTEADQNP